MHFDHDRNCYIDPKFETTSVRKKFSLLPVSAQVLSRYIAISK